MSVTKDNLFKAEKVSSSDKAASTTAAAKAIIDAEVLAREKKTEQLRKLRLEREAETPPAKPSRKR